MSFMYLSPVKGYLPVHLLEIIIRERLNYLKCYARGDAGNFNEFMIEGSLYDNVGHFMLCVIAILSKNVVFTDFLLKAETDLFKKRFEALSAYDIRCLSKRVLKFIKRNEIFDAHIKWLQILCQHMMLKELAQHITSVCNATCCLHTILLNFKACLTFVAKRQVGLKHGMVYLPCSKWKLYVVTLFKMNLKRRLSNTMLEPLNADPRITDLLLKLRSEILVYQMNYNSDVLLSKDVDRFSKMFPPCMSNLHHFLRKRHRLSHAQRFYYSLFLKDIGMPVEEAVDFWRNEYRQNPSGSNTCSHHWERDEKKFLYGIRHMYSLEGARKSYTSVSCLKIQSNAGSCSEGGCPFKILDSNKMKKFLKTMTVNEKEMSKIDVLTKSHQYTLACLMLLKSKYSLNCDDVSINFSPLNYYGLASKAEITMPTCV